MRIERRDVVSGVHLGDEMHPLLARIYAARGVNSVNELDHSLGNLHSYASLKDIDKAVDLLVQALLEKQRILIVGDFDADGATSCALAVLGLRALGASEVDYLIPNRFEFGYGLSPEIVEVAMAWSPHLLVTVDNGISSLTGVRAARAQGVKVLITDHHLPGPELQDANAVVNPNQVGCEFPSKCIAGVGVMFYVLLALRAKLRERGWFESQSLTELNLAELLDLVALGTVADVVALDQNNRRLVSQGLARIRAGRCRPGISALLRVAGRDREQVVASDMGFSVAPRLNAAGRLTDMARGVECLLSDDASTALAIAGELDKLNQERRSIEADMQEKAVASLSKLELDDALAVGLCLFDESWHQGVVGILASRIKERVHRPVIAFALEDEDTLKGSGRSIAGFHIRDALQDVSRAHPSLMTQFGGHAMAAGLTLPRENFDAFCAAFDHEAQRHLDKSTLEGVITTDGALQPEDMSLNAAEVLRNAGPWGQGFPEPVFDGEFSVVQSRILKDRHIKLVLGLPSSRRTVEAIQFNGDVDAWHIGVARVRIAYRLDVNEFRGVRSVNFIVSHLEATQIKE